jgi:uncharacterized membrane protein
MKSIKFLLAAALAATLGLLAACATRPAAVAANGPERVAGVEQCEQVTGSRIRPKNSDCTSPGYPYRSYSAEQLQGTGEIDLVEALRRIDPAFR